ncbi:MAG TPA: MipA/OmpV family protein [Gammaproteobacteria bacterium]
MMNHRTLIAGMLLLWLPFAGADERPQWEAGGGLGVISIADYRGSKEYRTRVLPIPYLIYRSRLLRIDREGVRGLLFSSDRIELNMSLNASLATRADDNPLRAGMPELDPTFEIGPSIDIRLTGERPKEGWILRLPARTVVAFSEDGLDRVGWLFNPNLHWRHRTVSGWQWGYTAGVYYADRDYHDYYYSVAPIHATNLRPAYRAQAGYSGFSNQVSLSRRIGNIWYGAYLRYDNLNGAELLDSPLVETEHYAALGVGISWIFTTSKTGNR